MRKLYGAPATGQAPCEAGTDHSKLARRTGQQEPTGGLCVPLRQRCPCPRAPPPPGWSAGPWGQGQAGAEVGRRLQMETVTTESWNASWETSVLIRQREADWEQEGGSRAPPRQSMHVHMHTRASSLVLVCAHARTHTCIHMHPHMCTHANSAHSRVQADTCAYTYRCTHAQTRVCTCTHTSPPSL